MNTLPCKKSEKTFLQFIGTGNVAKSDEEPFVESYYSAVYLQFFVRGRWYKGKKIYFLCHL